MDSGEQTFTIAQEKFEGPLPLLLHLIEKRKVAITDISLSHITDEYLAYLQSHPLTISENSSFIDTASTLLLIKSRALLPELELTTKEEADIEELQERLALYKKTREVADAIKSLTRVRSLFRSTVKNHDLIIFSPDAIITPSNITSSIRRLLGELPAIKKDIKVRLRSTVTLGEMIDSIFKRVQQNIRTNFAACTIGLKEKHDIVVSFLAVLELAKQQEINVSQNERYGTIDIELTRLDTPHVSI